MTNILDSLNALPKPTEPMDDLIALAQLGDRDATLKVIRGHMHILVSEINRSVRLITGPGFAPDSVSIRDDVTSDALQVFFRVLHAFDPERSKTGRLGSLLSTALRRDESMSSVVNRTRNLRVPVQMAIRRAAAIKEAGGDIEAGRALAKKHHISKETYDAISRVYDPGVSMNNEDAPAALFGASESGYVRIDDLHDTNRALDALDFTSRMIVESAFGLNGQPEQSNAEIGDSLGLSRWAVQRRIDAAMLVMKDALNDKENNRDE